MADSLLTQSASIDNKVEFMGVDLSPTDITNVHLRRIIGRIHHEKYKFSYDNHSQHYEEKPQWSQTKYHETRPYPDYKEYLDTYGDYHGPYDDGEGGMD